MESTIYASPMPVSARALSDAAMGGVMVGVPAFVAAVIKCGSAFGAVVISITTVILS